MGFCLYGNDIDDTTSPLEAGLGWVTKFSKEFTNSAALQDQKAAGVLEQKLVGFEMIDRGIPRHGYEIVDADGNNIGVVTSGTQSPSLQKAIGMGYVQTEPLLKKVPRSTSKYAITALKLKLLNHHFTNKHFETTRSLPYPALIPLIQG
jgi:glycine cleavage system aminomethyltransferase T